MSARTAFLSKLYGLFCLLYALVMFAHRNATIAEIQSIIGSPATIMALSVGVMAAGIAMVVGHNVWSGGPAAILVTLLGWATLFKGLVIGFLTPQGVGAYYDALHYEDFFYEYAAVTLIAGLYLTYAGFSQTPKIAASK